MQFIEKPLHIHYSTSLNALQFMICVEGITAHRKEGVKVEASAQKNIWDREAPTKFKSLKNFLESHSILFTETEASSQETGAVLITDEKFIRTLTKYHFYKELYSQNGNPDLPSHATFSIHKWQKKPFIALTFVPEKAQNLLLNGKDAEFFAGILAEDGYGPTAKNGVAIVTLDTFEKCYNINHSFPQYRQR